jgi:hypothetical protein
MTPGRRALNAGRRAGAHRRRAWSRAAWLALASILAAPGIARAHHLADDVGVLGLAPRSQLRVEVAAARFELDGERGSWQTLALSAERAFSPRASASLRVPFARVHHDDGDEATGLGDVEVGLRALLRAADRGGWRVAGGASLELPTGDSDSGLGAGHAEFGSVLAASTNADRANVLTLAVAHRVSLGGESHSSGEEGSAGKSAHEGEEGEEAHGAIIEPHSDHEVAVSVTGARLVEPLFASLGAEQVVSFDGPDDPTTLHATIGYLLAGHRRLITAGVEIPVGDDRRFEWKLRGGFRWSM